jgi:hypothetical protein
MRAADDVSAKERVAGIVLEISSGARSGSGSCRMTIFRTSAHIARPGQSDAVGRSRIRSQDSDPDMTPRELSFDCRNRRVVTALLQHRA